MFYRAFISHTYDLPVRQVVVYVGNEPHYITPRLEEFGLSYSFELVDFHNRSYREFLYKNTPEEIITAIICDFEGQDPEVIIQEIIEKVQVFELHRVKKCIIQLQILSNLRNLQPLVKENIKKMPILIDLSKDPLFAEQFEKTWNEALIQGEAKGLEQGKAKVIMGLLETARFSVDEIASFAKTSVEFVLKVQAEYLAQKNIGGNTNI